MKVDVIVNAANECLAMGGGVCGAIFRAAGEAQMESACRKIGHVVCGEAVVTPGFGLPARWVIHTAGPRWGVTPGGPGRACALLASCYARSLDAARDLGATSVAFPLISSGAFGCPKDVALEVATRAIRGWLQNNARTEAVDIDVYLVVFDRSSTRAAHGIDQELQEYIDQTYVDQEQRRHPRSARDLSRELGAADLSAPSAYGATSEASFLPLGADASAPSTLTPEDQLDGLLQNLDASFSETLLSMIDARGLTDAQVYNCANLTRQYFSKLRSGKMNPSKRVVLALAVALRLDLPQTRMLLERAGYSLSHSSKFDVIVEFYIGGGVYDVDAINYALFKHDQQLLGVA